MLDGMLEASESSNDANVADEEDNARDEPNGNHCVEEINP